MTTRLTTLVSLNGVDGAFPYYAGVTLDANGDLFGRTEEGGAKDEGTVFEIVNIGTVAAPAPTMLVSFNGSNGESPLDGLIADADGDLFGTTWDGGGIYDDGIKNTGTVAAPVYASAPTTLVGFDGSDASQPVGGLTVDANGNVFGTTHGGGANNLGTVFEIKNTGTIAKPAYASSPITQVRFNGSNGQSPVAGLTADARGNLLGSTYQGGALTAQLTTLVSFNDSNGAIPRAGLIADANGDLFGTTTTGGANDDGTVYEIQNTGTAAAPVYASAPTSLVSFNGSNGQYPGEGLLIADANGDLFGTTQNGGANNDGTVFEIQNTGTAAAPVYASTPATLVSFNGSNGAIPRAGLTLDANCDLFGTTEQGGANGDGTVFEIQNTGTVAAPVYTSAPTTLVSFNGSNGTAPEAGLIADANGDLFGTTLEGGANGDGTVFEIQNTGTAAAPVYASAPATLVSFNGSNGQHPNAGLMAGANGDLFGTTENGGANLDGTVFEIQNTGTAAAPVYAIAPTTLVSFNGSNGAFPLAWLIADAKGDLFGTTDNGGANNDGTVFEIQNIGTVAAPVYASAPTTLVSFNGSNGAAPYAGLIAGANGDLFGTTESGGANGDGTVFEITGAGFVDQWNNIGDWNLNAAADWSLGTAPTSTTAAEIETGSATISTTGAAGLLTIDSGATLILDYGTTLAVTNGLDNAGTWTLGGGDAATIGGSLANSGALDIGATDISASTTVTAAALDNTGGIYLQGATASGATNAATLDITGGAPTVLAGRVVVAGDATLEFGGGGITTIR